MVKTQTLVRMWDNRNSSFIAGGSATWYSHCRAGWQFFRYLNTSLPYDPSIMLLGIYPNELTTCPKDKKKRPAHECL